MSMPLNSTSRRRLPGKARVEAAAIFLLRHIIAWSVKEQQEYGGVIYPTPLMRSVTVLSAPPHRRTPSIWQDQINLGLTQKPLAWYHTHPLPRTAGTEWDKFEGGDYRLSTTRRIPGYVCTMDGWIWLRPVARTAGRPETGASTMTSGQLGQDPRRAKGAVDSAHAREYKQPAGLHW